MVTPIASVGTSNGSANIPLGQLTALNRLLAGVKAATGSANIREPLTSRISEVNPGINSTVIYGAKAELIRAQGSAINLLA